LEIPAAVKMFFRSNLRTKFIATFLAPRCIIFREHITKMVRKLKHHEQKLLRKVDFTTYKSDHDHRDAAVIRRYAIQKPSDYSKYSRLCGVRPLYYFAVRLLGVLRGTPIPQTQLLTCAESVPKTTRAPACRPSANFHFPTDS
jgi:hypothetical protein